MAIAQQDYGGVSVDEAVSRLVDEHWERQAIEAMDRFRLEDPDGYAEYLDEVHDLSEVDVAVSETWDER
jgi:hypothetical protein